MQKTVKMRLTDVIVWTVSLVLAYALLMNEALADSRLKSAANEKWQAECGSCHIAYPPSLLPAASWQRMMAGLEKHFGTDASLDARSAAEIGAFLERNAGSGKYVRGSNATLRITESPWFLRKHDEISAATWKNPRVKSAANCGACHMGAERGEFDEHAVRVPR